MLEIGGQEGAVLAIFGDDADVDAFASGEAFFTRGIRFDAVELAFGGSVLSGGVVEVIADPLGVLRVEGGLAVDLPLTVGDPDGGAAFAIDLI